MRRIGIDAARAAIDGVRSTATTIGGYSGGILPAWDAERELEGTDAFELEAELAPIRRVYPDVLMEHLGHAATLARDEAEAEAFIGALVPLATALLPRLAPSAARVAARGIPQAVGMMRTIAPRLIAGVARTTRMLRQNPATRQLVRALPAVVRSTVADLARQYARDQRLAPQAAGRTLARHTARVLSSPLRAVQAYRRSQALDRQYHRAADSPPAGRPAVAGSGCRCKG
jgi:hypothetical protein